MSVEQINLFKAAALNKYRWQHNSAKINVEDLATLAVEDLDNIAVNLDREIKTTATTTFRKNAQSLIKSASVQALEIKLAIVVELIADKEAAREKAVLASKAQAQAAMRKSLAQQALDAKQVDSMASMTEDQLKAILEE